MAFCIYLSCALSSVWDDTNMVPMVKCVLVYPANFCSLKAAVSASTY